MKATLSVNIGRDYLLEGVKVKAVRVTEKGYNFLKLDGTGEMFYKKSLYKTIVSRNCAFPDGHVELNCFFDHKIQPLEEADDGNLNWKAEKKKKGLIRRFFGI